MKKRLFVLLMILSLLPIGTVRAVGEDFIEMPAEKQLPHGSMARGGELFEPISNIGFFSVTKGIGETKKQELYNLLYNGMKNHEARIDISALSIPIENFSGDVIDVYFRVLLENPEIMAYSYLRGSEDAENVYIASLTPSYLFADKTADDAANLVVEAGMKHYTDLAATVPDTLGKILVVHDELAKNISYDHDGLAIFNEHYAAGTATAEDWQIRTAYGLFSTNKAVCQGYAIVLAEIYKRLGLEVGFCSSDLLEHIWLVVKYNGEWYHLDPTSNDATITYRDAERTGAFHNFFMISSDTNASRGNSKEGAVDWRYWADEEVTCTDKSLEDGQIYTGDYVWDGTNYGSWYGTTTYENGRYRIGIDMLAQYNATDDKVYYYIGARVPLYSATVKSPGAIASDIYSTTTTNSAGETVNVNAVSYFVNTDETAARLFVAGYNESLLAGVSMKAITLTQGAMFGTMIPTNANKVFLWRQTSVSRLCEARTR